MLLQRPRRIPEPIASSAAATSPKGWRERDSDGRIGLAIVAALEKSVIDTAPGKIVLAVAPNLHASASVSAGRNGISIREDQEDSSATFPMADFLSRCYLCKKSLHGKDVYMYGGEKAFCSAECRFRRSVVRMFPSRRKSPAAAAGFSLPASSRLNQ